MFLTIIILALLAYLLWPMVKAMLAVREVQRNVRDAFGRAAAGAAGQRPGQQPPRPRRSRKKIDKDVGEYVEYEEIIGSAQESASHNSGSSHVGEVESQIVDAEWEELPPRKE